MNSLCLRYLDWLFRSSLDFCCLFYRVLENRFRILEIRFRDRFRFRLLCYLFLIGLSLSAFEVIFLSTVILVQIDLLVNQKQLFILYFLLLWLWSHLFMDLATVNYIFYWYFRLLFTLFCFLYRLKISLINSFYWLLLFLIWLFLLVNCLLFL